MTDLLKTLYPVFLEHPAISTDSRQVQPGSLFFALKGDNFNGNAFALTALEKGAAFAVVDEAEYGSDPRCILTGNVLQTLQELATHHRNQFDIPVIAVTGTNGKTTTKELAFAVLSEKYNTLATKGNLNNHIGVPLTLLKMTRETEIALIEMGANHPGEIDFLCRIAQPGFGLITNIGRAHLEGFGGFQGVVRTKTELYRFLRETGGTVFLNNQDELLQEHATGITTVTYGKAPADLVAANIEAEPFVRMHLLYTGGCGDDIVSGLYGRYNASNILAAAVIGQHFGVSPRKIKTAVESYRPDNNRSQVTQTARNLLIMDAYNANPSSMEAALTTFAKAGYPDKTIILGDMLELGADTDAEHRLILDLIDDLGFPNVYLVGPVFTRLNTRRENLCFHDSELARLWLEFHKITQQTILIKGSRGIRLEKLVAEL
ncbi:MAG: UDP-N-acetylmuramoyl-tripeptide--D-alanyl-D-alanine ligase [Bacteroidota bacterium]